MRVYLPLVTAPPDPLREMELEFVRLLNDERARRGLQPLADEPRFSAYMRDAVASLVAERIAALGLDEGCEHVQRYQAVRAFVVSETLACGDDSADSAVYGLLASPRHAPYLLHPDADTIGIGVAPIPGSPWGGYVFAARPAVTNIIAAEDLKPYVPNAINAHRAALGLPPLTPNAALDRAAQRLAAQIAAQPPHPFNGSWFIDCRWDDPTTLAQEEGYRGRTWTKSLCEQNAGFKYRSSIPDDLARMLTPPSIPESPRRAAYQAEWRAIGVGVAYAYTDPWHEPALSNSHTFIIVILGDDPNG